jgi:hypothetical protein
MNQSKLGAKRARTDQPDNNQARTQAAGCDKLLIAEASLQTRLGQKYCNEADLLSLLLAHGIVRRVRTIEVNVQPLGGDSFQIKLDASKPSVGEAKKEIARTQGMSEARQDLYKVSVRADGSAVREDDAEPEALDDDATELGNGELVAMAVKEEPLLWRTCDAEKVALSEGGAVATRTGDHHEETLVTSDDWLTVGKHYWEVEIVNSELGHFYVGVTRPNLNPNRDLSYEDSTDAWFIWTFEGRLCGNGKGEEDDDEYQPGDIEQGDRVGVLLDLHDGSLRFFKNGVQHGPGYPAGSVTGPVVCAVQLSEHETSARVLPQDKEHILLQ